MSTREPNVRLAKAVFASLALLSVLAGAALYLLRRHVGIAEDTARLVATAFIFTGIVDTVVLLAWDRIFRRPP